MELEIRGLGLQSTPDLKRYVGRRLRHTLRSFHIDRVTVRLIRDHGRGRHATQSLRRGCVPAGSPAIPCERSTRVDSRCMREGRFPDEAGALTWGETCAPPLSYRPGCTNAVWP